MNADLNTRFQEFWRYANAEGTTRHTVTIFAGLVCVIPLFLIAVFCSKTLFWVLLASWWIGWFLLSYRSYSVSKRSST